MPGDDRFGDLGPSEEKPTGKSAAERFAELDEREAAEAGEKRRSEGRQRPGGRYAWVIGFAFFIVIVVGMVRRSPTTRPSAALDTGTSCPSSPHRSRRANLRGT